MLLQVSFDEFHQEIVADRDGALRERIPVAKIANVVEAAPRHPEIQLCLVHKQTALSFSMDLFRKGVFGRLTEELGRRGHQVRILAAAPSPRLKQHPHDPARTGQVVKDASFVVARYPERPILLTSSTVDAYGRAALLEPGETVNERALLRRILDGGDTEGERSDTDLMFWHNGWATLFAAVHVCLGNVHDAGADRVHARHRKDPLTAALGAFDRRVLAYYSEIRGDLAQLADRTTGPHHLVTGLGIGLFASTIANTQQEAMLTVWMTLLPSIFLSGFFFPLEAMPKFLQWLSYLMPLRYYLVIIRSLLLKGVGISLIQTDVLAMTLFAVGIMTAAALRFRKRLD